MIANAVFCPNCGMRSESGDSHCRACGTPLPVAPNSFNPATTPTPASAPQPAAETFIKQQMGYNKNYALGILFAIGAALIGTVAWAIIGMLGWIVGWAGYLIALLSSKFYDFSKTRVDMVKFWTVIACVILAVTLGTFAGTIGEIFIALNESGLSPSISDCFEWFDYLWNDISGDFSTNLIMGYVFGGLGSYSVLKEVKANSTAVKAAEDSNQY